MTQRPFLSFNRFLLVLILFLIIASTPFWLTDLDFSISDQFYNVAKKNWPAQGNGTFWKFIYTYGVIPGLLAILGSILVIIRSYLKPGMRLSRIKSWCVILALVLGPGLVVNGIFKPNFGRSRPYDIQRYGGEQQFQKLFVPGEKGESFPAGHPSTGFVLTIFFFLAYPRNRKKAWVYLAGAMSLGILLGIARISQGGHFTSDVLWSFGMTQIVNMIVYFKLLKMPEKEFADYTNSVTTPSTFKKVGFYSAMLLISGGFVFSFMAAYPVDHHQTNSSVVPVSADTLTLDLSFKKEDILLYRSSNPFVSIDYLVLAHGFPWSRFLAQPSITFDGRKATYHLVIHKSGFTPEYRGRIKLFIPDHIKIINNITSEKGTILDKR